MRVLILHSRYRSGSTSGENRVVEDEALLLDGAGHAVEVWDPSSEGLHGAGLLRAGVGVGLAALRREGDAAEDPRLPSRRVVHVHNLFPMLSPVVLRSAAAEGVPVVMTLHNYRLQCLAGTCLRDGQPCELCIGRTPLPGVAYRCYQGSTAASAALATSLLLHRAAGSFERVSLYLVVGEFVREMFLKAGMDPVRIRVKSNFAWPLERRRGPGEVFAYVGRLSREKGVDTLIDAWGGVSALLVVVGDGPDGRRLRAAAPSNVEFLGDVPPRDVGGVLQRTRALIVPSLSYEAAPKAGLEAYAAGVPLIASRIGGLPDLVEEGSSGRLVPPGDAGAIAAAVEALGDDAEAERLGEGAYRLWRARYSPDHGLRALEDAYRMARA